VRLAQILAVAAAIGIAPHGPRTRQWANDYEPRTPRALSDAERERIARAEAKRARKAAARRSGGAT
jgi:hypothetical protein